MGVVAPQAPVGVHGPLQSLVMGPSLLGNCYLENKFHKKITQIDETVYLIFLFE